MGSEEVAVFSLSLNQVVHHQEDTGTLQVKVDISVHERIISEFVSCIFILQVILSDSRSIVGLIVFGEVSHIGNHFYFLDFLF